MLKFTLKECDMKAKDLKNALANVPDEQELFVEVRKNTWVSLYPVKFGDADARRILYMTTDYIDNR